MPGEPKLAPVTQLSDSEESHDDPCELADELPKRRRQRRKAGPSLKDRLLNADFCRNLLQKRCGGSCKRNCLAQFLKKHVFEQVLDFRKFWRDLHKLDQDRIVPCPSLVKEFDEGHDEQECSLRKCDWLMGFHAGV